MLKGIARTIAKLIAPILLEQLVIILEDLLKEDFNNDGIIGNPNKD